MIKPNKEELENIMGFTITNENDAIQAAKNLLNKNVEIIVISLGSEGAMAFLRTMLIR